MRPPFGFSFSLFSSPGSLSAKSCYKALIDLQMSQYQEGPVLVYAKGTRVPIARAFEKEGLFYSDISDWFDRVKKEPCLRDLNRRLEQEMAGKKSKLLLPWLDRYLTSYRAAYSGISKKHNGSLSGLQARIELLFNRENRLQR